LTQRNWEMLTLFAHRTPSTLPCQLIIKLFAQYLKLYNYATLGRNCYSTHRNPIATVAAVGIVFVCTAYTPPSSPLP